jgi:hypothetical protein
MGQPFLNGSFRIQADRVGFMRLAEPTGSAPLRAVDDKGEGRLRNEHARQPTPWHVVFREKVLEWRGEPVPPGAL